MCENCEIILAYNNVVLKLQSCVKHSGILITKILIVLVLFKIGSQVVYPYEAFQ